MNRIFKKMMMNLIADGKKQNQEHLSLRMKNNKWIVMNNWKKKNKMSAMRAILKIKMLKK
jgi:hypothetical protein